MRSLIIATVVALVMVPAVGRSQEPIHVFVLTGGSLQVGDTDPVPLKDGSVRQRIASGDVISLFYDIAVKAGQQNLCSEREVVVCELHVSIGKREMMWIPFLVGANGVESNGAGFCLPPDIPAGDTDLKLIIRKNGIELFSYSIPVTVN